MKSSTRTAAIVLAVAALLLTGSAAHAQGVWSVVSSPNEFGSDVMFGADASDAGHVWAVGRVIIRDVEFRSRIYRYDGTAWRSATLSGVTSESELSAVDAVSGTEAWAAGTSYPDSGGSTTLVARWNGSTWAPESTPNGTSSGGNALTGVAAAGGTVWAVGSYYEPGATRRALILQRTSSSAPAASGAESPRREYREPSSSTPSMPPGRRTPGPSAGAPPTSLARPAYRSCCGGTASRGSRCRCPSPAVSCCTGSKR
jgi:hypothetical protein